MRTEEQIRPSNDSQDNSTTRRLDRVVAQYESLSRLASDAIVEPRTRARVLEVPCKLAPAIRRRRLLS